MSISNFLENEQENEQPVSQSKHIKHRMEFALILIIVGIVWLISSIHSVAAYEQTIAYVNDIKYSLSNEKTVYITYTANNTVYNNVELQWLFKGRLDKYSEVKIYYNTKDPLDYKVAEYIFVFPILFIAAGIVLMLIMLIYQEEVNRKTKIVSKVATFYMDDMALLMAAPSVKAEVIDFECDYSTVLNNTSPYILDCAYFDPDTATSLLFKSDPVWFDPNEVDIIGEYADVYINPNDKTNYYVDAEGLYNRLIYESSPDNLLPM